MAFSPGVLFLYLLATASRLSTPQRQEARGFSIYLSPALSIAPGQEWMNEQYSPKPHGRRQPHCSSQVKMIQNLHPHPSLLGGGGDLGGRTGGCIYHIQVALSCSEFLTHSLQESRAWSWELYQVLHERTDVAASFMLERPCRLLLSQLYAILNHHGVLFWVFPSNPLASEPSCFTFITVAYRLFPLRPKMKLPLNPHLRFSSTK